MDMGTRSLILTMLASVYIPLVLVASYCGMNAEEIAEGDLIFTSQAQGILFFVMVANVVVPLTLYIPPIKTSAESLLVSARWLNIWLALSLLTCAMISALLVAKAVTGRRASLWVIWIVLVLYMLNFLGSIPVMYLSLRFFDQWGEETATETKTRREDFRPEQTDSSSSTSFTPEDDAVLLFSASDNLRADENAGHINDSDPAMFTEQTDDSSVIDNSSALQDRSVSRNSRSTSIDLDNRSATQPTNSIYRLKETNDHTPDPRKKQACRHDPKSDPYAPRRPQTAYILFANAIREQSKNENPSCSELSGTIYRKWRAMPGEEKERWRRMSARQ